MHEVVGLILAGGNSVRMGRDKSKLDFKGQSLLERIIAEHKKIVKDVFVIGKETADVKNAIGIKDDIRNLGPIGGLYTGMKNIESKWYLISPCDMPFLKFSHLKKIMDAGLEKKTGAIIAKSEKGLEPLVAMYHKSVLSVMESNIKKGNFAIRAIFSMVKSTYIYFDGKIFEKDPFFNINYPKDYLKALTTY